MNIRTINLGFSVIVICILFIDFFVTNEFHIERGYLYVFAFLLILNICRLTLGNKIQAYVIGICINLSLLGFLIYSAAILVILSFGIGFTGRNFPLIMGLSIIVNLGFIGVLMIETMKLIKTKTKHNLS